MATLKLTLSYIARIKIDPHNRGCIIVDCDMNFYGYESIIAQICEQMGDDDFMDLVNKMVGITP